MKTKLLFLVSASFVVIFFFRFFLFQLLPIPNDIITGVYYPWLDYKWDNAVGVAVRNPLMSDIPSLIYPWRTLAMELVNNWQWPLWNQYSFSGYPLLGNWQSAPFSPANIFYFIFSQPIAWSIGVIFQPLLAAYFMMWWLKSKGLSKHSSILGGILYAFSGFHFTWMYYNTHQWTTLWLPLMLLATDKILAGNRKWLVWLSLIFALSILSGYPILLVYMGVITGFYFVTRLNYSFVSQTKFRLRFSTRIIFYLFISLLLGLGLSAIQWLPGLETIRLSIHELDQSALASANQGFLPLSHLITALIPDFFGNPATYNYWGTGYYDNLAFYISIAGLMLALIAWLNDKSSRWWLGLTLFGLLLATDNQFGNWLRQISLILNNSIPARALFLVDFGIAVSAAYGLESLISGKLSWRRTIGSILFFGLIFASVWILVINSQSWNYTDIITHRNVIIRNLILPTGIYLLSSFLIIFSLLPQIKFKHSRTFLLSLLVVIVIFDLFRYGWKYLPFTPRNYLYPHTEITDWLQKKQLEEGPFRVEFGEVIPENMWIPYRLESAAGYDALQPLRSGQFIEAIQSGRLTGNVSRFPKIENLDSKLWELSNTKYVLALKYSDKWERRAEGTQIKEIYRKDYLRPVFEYETVTILENQRYLPRAIVVPNAEVVENDAELIEVLNNPQTDFRQTVYLSEKYSLLAKTDIMPESQITWDQQPQPSLSRRLEVITDKPAYLLLLESYHPGWQVTITSKGAMSKIASQDQTTKVVHFHPRRADFNFMAIPLEPGQSQVELKFQPKSFQTGLWITGLSLIVWLSLIFRLTKPVKDKY